MTTIIIVVLFLAVAAYLYKDSKKSKAPAPTAKPFPCVIEGSIDAPPMDERVKALAIEAQSKGITITGDYAKDVAAQGGEMYLAGSFRFDFDDNGNVRGDSWMKIFSDVKYPITGSMAADGTLGMDCSVEGAIINIRGRVIDGKLTNGRMFKSWLPHIGGVLNGVIK